MSDEIKQGPYRISQATIDHSFNYMVEDSFGFEAWTSDRDDAELFRDRLNSQAARIAELEAENEAMRKLLVEAKNLLENISLFAVHVGTYNRFIMRNDDYSKKELAYHGGQIEIHRTAFNSMTTRIAAILTPTPESGRNETP